VDYNYHTHTVLCHHATGTPEEYIQNALEHGIRYMGFSEHLPFRFPDGSESDYRVSTEEGKDYCVEICKLKEQYKDKMDLAVGFEMEYYAEYFDEMLQNAREYGAEYLILGQHFVRPENSKPAHYVLVECMLAKELKAYTDAVIAGMETGVFTYVAHPDIFNFTGDSGFYRREMQRLCKAAKKTDTPLEINCLGIREKRNYPANEFWAIAGEEQAPVTIGFDAHAPEVAYDGASLEVAMDMIERYGLHYIGRPTLKPLD